MVKIDLNELERLHKAATPGPWKHRTISKTATVILAADIPLCATKYSVNKDHDAAYIVAACNSLPELIVENRALRADIGCLKQSLEWRDGVIADLRRKLEQAAEEAGE